MHKRRLYGLVLGSVMVATLVASVLYLGRRAKLLDDSIVSLEPCKLPCWNDLIPDETSSNEVLIGLSQISSIDPTSVIYSGDLSSTGTAYWNFYVERNHYNNHIDWVDGVIDEIGYQQNAKIRVDEVIEIYGEPEWVCVLLTGRPFEEEYAVNLFFPDQGIQFMAYLVGINAEIKPSSVVDVVLSYSPMTIEERYKMIFGEDRYRYFERDIKPWRGYGPVDIYAPDT